MEIVDDKKDEQLIIKTLCDFLFFDQFQDTASFPRFEQCFQPLFNNLNISMEKVFKDICGPKKKYITYKRFAKAYLNHKNNKDNSPDTKTFFEKLLNSILKKEDSFVGSVGENIISFSTRKTCKNRDCITLLQVLSDKEGNIHGINLEYDGVFQSKMYPKNLEEILILSLDMNLGIIDDKSKIKENIEKFSFIEQGNYRDAITHIFGTINKESGFITFLGFKCISGKTVFVGFPEGDGFLFGKFGNKLHDLKLQMTDYGITLIKPGFKENLKKNFFLQQIKGELSSQNLEQEEIIKDEEHFSNIKDNDEIDELITTQIVEDDHFFDNRLKDEISGNDYKEVVDQHPRQWILNEPRQKYLQTCIMQKKEEKNSLTLDDALNIYKDEHEKTKIKTKTMIRGGNNQSTIFKNKKAIYNKTFYDKWLEPFKPYNEPSFGPDNIDQKNLPYISNPFAGGENEDVPKQEIQKNQPEETREPTNQEDEGIILHKTRIYKPSKVQSSGATTIGTRLNRTQIKWNGKIDNKTQSSMFLRKDNYQGLKQKLGRMIHEQVMETNDNPEQLEILDEIVPYPGSYTRIVKRKKSFSDDINTDTVIKMKNKKGKVITFGNNESTTNESKENSEKNKEIENEKKDENENNVTYSEATEFWNKITTIKKKPNKNENREEEKKEDETESDYSHGFNKLRGRQKNVNIIDNNQQFVQLRRSQMIKDDFDPKKYEVAQQKWKFFKEGLEKINGVYLIQTIGSIIKAKKVIEKELILPTEEQIKLYKLIEENQKIIDFLNQNEDVDEEEEEYDNYLIPDEHPEKITSLAVIQKDLDNIRELLYNTKIKPEDRKKVEQLRDLYMQQKNILIENQTKNSRVQLVRKNCINVKKYLKEEEEKRKKAQEEENKRIEEELRKKREKEEEELLKKQQMVPPVSIVARKKESRTYHQQKPPKTFEPWTDDIFPPKKISLCPYNKEGWVRPEDVLEDDVQGWEDIEWCRAEEIKNFSNYNVFVDGATLDDIKQGDIGDCYFFSTVGALCSYSEFFDKLFQIKDKSEDHVYGVYLYLNGRWKLVLVDDFLPYKGLVIKELSFSTSFQNELWVALIEKAWAKVNGCYARIGCGGFCYEAFDVLTEAFTEHIELRFYKSKNKQEELWNKMQQAIKKKYVMAAGTYGDDVDFDLEEVGLCYGHAYTLVNIYTVKTNKGEERLVKLKNPWGNTEFTGEWSDYSKKWTPQLKKECEFSEESDDGIFYMSFKDYMKYYMVMDIAKIELGYQTSFCKVKKEQSKTCQVIKMEIKEEYPTTFIQIYQKNPRIVRKDGTYFKVPVMAFIMLVRQEGNEFKYIDSVADNDVHMAIEVNLKPGTYYIFSDVNYRYGNPDYKSYGYTLTCYARKGKQPIVLENVTQKVDRKKYLEVSLFDYCKKKLGTPTKDKSGIEVYISENFKREVPFHVFCFVNPKNEPMKVELKVESEEKNKKKCFCIYNDKIASEFDSSVIKSICPKSATCILVMGYSRDSKYKCRYDILPPNDKRTYENSHPVFNSKKESYDDEGRIFSYALKVEDGKGFIIGVENVSNIEFKLRLILEDVFCIDDEYAGKGNPEFKLLPKSKKIFNVRVTGKDPSFDIEFI